MIRKTFSILLLSVVLLLTLSTAVLAQAELPVGQCPNGFELHEAMEHDMPDHQHAGLKVDINQDGMICVKHVTESIHVHVDNFVR